MPNYPQRLCELPTCREEFTPTRSYQRYCCHKHSKAAYVLLSDEERAARRATKRQRHPKARYVYEALEEAEPGMCPWGCERRLRPRQRTNCGDPECEKAYQNAYRLGRVEVERPTREATCACGCGAPFTTRNPRQRYVSPEHEEAARKARRKEARKLMPPRPLSPPKRGRAIVFGAKTESGVLTPFPRERR